MQGKVVRLANWKLVFFYGERSNNFIDSVNKPFAKSGQGKSWVDLYSLQGHMLKTISHHVKVLCVRHKKPWTHISKFISWIFKTLPSH